MGELVNLDDKRKKKRLKVTRATPQEQMLLLIGSEIDIIITKYLQNPKVSIKDIAGVIAHRFGSLLGIIDKKEELWQLCQGIIKRQAKLKNGK